MIQKWIGAGCVFLACSAAGFCASASINKEEQLLQQSKRMLERMESELSCRATSLSQLCLCAQGCGKELERLYSGLSKCLDEQVFPDASYCMEAVLGQESLPRSVTRIHAMLGQTLGSYDLSGQLEELVAVKAACQESLDSLRQNISLRSRSYRTLGLCAGAALAILLM